MGLLAKRIPAVVAAADSAEPTQALDLAGHFGVLPRVLL